MFPKPDRVDALFSLVPNCSFAWVGDEYSGLDWTDERTKPTEDEINAEIKKLQDEYDAQEYARNRKAEYDDLNQFEMQYDDDVNDTTTWKDAIVAIKAKWPKDNSGPK